MSVLFFLPWVSLSEVVEVDGIRFIPYSRGKEPAELRGVPIATLDAVLGSYGNQVYRSTSASSLPITDAVLVSWDGDEEGLELAEDMIQARLDQLNYVIFSALAKRRFGQNSGYCNTEGYMAVAQRFSPDRPGATLLTSRRKDGAISRYNSAAPVPRFIRPEHVDNPLRFDVDMQLLQALLRLPEGELKQRIDQSIDAFLRANTDSPSMSERSEVVLMQEAFEALLGANHTKEDFRRKVGDHLTPDLPDPVVWSTGPLTQGVWLKRWPSNVKRPIDAWAQDFSASRNAAAHGSKGSHAPTVWALRNHLLFSSWLFPLMIKQLLSDEGLYTLTHADKVYRAGAEAFLGYDLMAPSGDGEEGEEGEEDMWWARIEHELRLKILALIMFPEFAGT